MEAKKRLIQKMVRLSHGTECVVVVDALLRHGCAMTVQQLRKMLPLTLIDIHRSVTQLRTSHLVSSTLPEAEEACKSTLDCSVDINYTAAFVSLEHILRRMAEMLDADMNTDVADRESLRCTSCCGAWKLLDVIGEDDERGLRCPRCEGALEDQTKLNMAQRIAVNESIHSMYEELNEALGSRKLLAVRNQH